MISPIKKTHPPPLIPAVPVQIPTQNTTPTPAGGYTDAHPSDEEMFKRRYVAIQDIINELEDENNLIAYRIAKLKKSRKEEAELAIQKARQAEAEALAAEERERQREREGESKLNGEEGLKVEEGDELEGGNQVEELRDQGNGDEGMEVDFDDQLDHRRGPSTHLTPVPNERTNTSNSPLIAHPPSPTLLSRHPISDDQREHNANGYRDEERLSNKGSEEDVEMDDY